MHLYLGNNTVQQGHSHVLATRQASTLGSNVHCNFAPVEGNGNFLPVILLLSASQSCAQLQGTYGLLTGSSIVVPLFDVGTHVHQSSNRKERSPHPNAIPTSIMESPICLNDNPRVDRPFSCYITTAHPPNNTTVPRNRWKSSLYVTPFSEMIYSQVLAALSDVCMCMMFKMTTFRCYTLHSN